MNLPEAAANAESLSVLLGSGNATKILKGLFFPQLRLSGVFYSPYRLGFLGTLMLTVLVATMFRRRWSDSVMAWGQIAIVAGVPVFVYILNGGLYLRDKALIPLIPLFLLYACHVFKEGEL